jgi:hypothetical protein
MYCSFFVYEARIGSQNACQPDASLLWFHLCMSGAILTLGSNHVFIRNSPTAGWFYNFMLTHSLTGKRCQDKAFEQFRPVPEVWEEVPMVYMSYYKYMRCYIIRVEGIYCIYYVFCPLTI